MSLVKKRNEVRQVADERYAHEEMVPTYPVFTHRDVTTLERFAFMDGYFFRVQEEKDQLFEIQLRLAVRDRHPITLEFLDGE